MSSLLLTAAAWYISDSSITRRVADRFHRKSEELQVALGTRLNQQEDALRGRAALFAASEAVERKHWLAFVERLELAKNFPGPRGFGFGLLIGPREKTAHIQHVRDEGLSQYDVWPRAERDAYAPVIYLEPFVGRDLRAFGYDMLSEPARRAAMELARDSGTAVVSAMTKLAHESDQEAARGFVMYLPVYRTVQSPESTEARRAALMGYVFSPFRIDDLMAELSIARSEIDLAIYDGEELSADKLLYESNTKNSATSSKHRPKFMHASTFAFGGHEWTLYFQSPPEYVFALEKSLPLLVAASGIFINILLVVIIYSTSKRQRRSEKVARKTTEKLRQASVDTRAIVENVVDGLITVDEFGVVESVNPAAAEMFGYAVGEMTGRPVKTFFMGRGREMHGRRKDGSVFPMDLTIGKIRRGTRTVFVTAVRNITERKQIERLKNEFISIVSHELRTPLTSIIGSLGLMAGGAAGDLGPKVRDLVRIAHENSERLKNLINDILDIEKIESGHMQFDMSEHRLVRLIEQSVEANQGYARRLGISLEVSVALPADIQVQVDADRFMQVMANLISNAAKFSPPTGKVKISADRHSAGIRIGVRDYGDGIPPELQGRIFQKFFQADSSDARAKGGTGLGLSISKAIVEHMNGRIGFATTVGAGTLFYVDLPLWSESPAIAGDDHSQDFQEAAGIGEPQGNSHGA